MYSTALGKPTGACLAVVGIPVFVYPRAVTLHCQSPSDGSRPSATLALASGTLVCGTELCCSVSATTSGASDSARVRPARQQQSEMSMRTLATPKPGCTPVLRYKDGVVTIDRLLRVDVVADDTVANQATLEFELGRTTTQRVVHWDYAKLPTQSDQSISQSKAEAVAHFNEEAVSLIDSISANQLARGQRAALGTWLIWVHEIEAPKRVAFPTTPAARPASATSPRPRPLPRQSLLSKSPIWCNTQQRTPLTTRTRLRWCALCLQCKRSDSAHSTEASVRFVPSARNS